MRGVRSGPALAALALGAFTVGTAELVIVGVLDLVADDLRVAVSTAGQLVTAYALGISIGGPVISALTVRVGRRPLLVALIALLLAGNVVAVVATSFGALLAARIVTGSLHGVFIGVASVVAADLVGPESRGKAVSTSSAASPSPPSWVYRWAPSWARRWVWQVAFVGIVAMGALALAATLVAVPPVHDGAAVSGLLLLGGQFTVFTYLTPYLEDVTGISGTPVSAFLFGFGIAAAVGTFAGGRAADRGAARTLLVANVLLILALLALWLVGADPVLTAVALVAWGFVGFGLVPALQLRVITLARAGGDVAATLGAAVNAGIAAGAVIGGYVISRGDAGTIVLVGTVICLLALPLTWATRTLTPPGDSVDPVQTDSSTTPGGNA